MTTPVLFAARPLFNRGEIGFWGRLRDALCARDLTLVVSSSADWPVESEVEHVTSAGSPDDFWPVADGALAGVPVSLLGLDEETLLARVSALTGPALVPAVERCRREALTLIAAKYLQCLQTLAPVLTIIQQGHHLGEWILASASRVGETPVLYTEGEPTTEGLFDADVLAERIMTAAARSPWRAPETLMREMLRVQSEGAAAWPARGTTWLDRRDAFSARLDEWHYGHALRSALLPAYEAARRHRPVRVWGSGAARHAVGSLLEAAGASVDERVLGAEGIRITPVPDFIIVATAAHDGTTHHLESLGFRRGFDYSIVEPHVLHALHLQAAA